MVRGPHRRNRQGLTYLLISRQPIPICRGPPLVAKEVNDRGKNATFPSLHPVPADPCKSPQGSLPTTRGRRRGYSNALGSLVRPRRYESCGCSHGLQVSAPDAPFFACSSSL